MKFLLLIYEVFVECWQVRDGGQMGELLSNLEKSLAPGQAFVVVKKFEV